MPKYLFEARYSPEGAIGLAKEGGTGRRDAVKKHLKEIGGKLESMYFAFGDVDCFRHRRPARQRERGGAFLPRRQRKRHDSRARRIVLLTPEEMDQAAKTKVHFRGQGRSLRPDPLPTRRRFMLWAQPKRP